ncbi:MAG: hypothetical protein PUA87_05190 [Oscillospiraceae bacterium]|nr:hypothetical protein [Oscillospiraceae bacterium]
MASLPDAASNQDAASAEESSTPENNQVAAQNFDIPMPLTEEPVTFTYFMRFNPQVQDWCQDMSDNLFYSTLEEKSGVHIEFQLFHPMNFSEQFNLQMASQDYADFYCEAASGYTGGYDKGVEDEVFLDLTPYIHPDHDHPGSGRIQLQGRRHHHLCPGELPAVYHR